MAGRKAGSNQCFTGKRRIGGKKISVAARLEQDFSYRLELAPSLLALSFVALLLYDMITPHAIPIGENLSPDVPQKEIAALYPRPLVSPGRVPILHLSQYPTAHFTDTIGSASDKGNNAHSKQQRLTETVGRRDRDLKRRS